MKKLAAALLLAATMALAQVHAQVPLRIPYQGYLTTSAGVPPGNGGVQMRFRIYDAPSGGSVLWDETQTVVVLSGVFGAVLGSATALDAALFTQQRYLGVTVGTDGEMVPRQALGSVPYAIRANSAASADSALSVSGTVSGEQITGTISGVTLSGSALTQLDGRYSTAPNVAPPQAPALNAVEAGGWSPSITIAPDGLPVIAHMASGPQRLRVVRCANLACSAISSAVDVETGNVDSPSIAIGPDGLPVISYSRYVGPFEIRVLKCGTPACDSGNSFATVDTGGAGSYAWTSLAIGIDGLPVLSFVYHVGPLKVAKCGNPACSAGNTVTQIESNVSNWSTIAVPFDGLPVVGYPSSGMKLLKCGNPACSSGNAVTTVEGGFYVGAHASVAIGSDGLPVLAYSHFDGVSQYSLRVAKCGSASCSSGNTLAFVDSAYGYQNAINVGTDGMPVVSYVTFGNDLKVAKCGNASCTAGNSVMTLDTGMVVFQTSMTIAPDGIPTIAYREQDSNALKLARCPNSFCAPYFRRR